MIEAILPPGLRAVETTVDLPGATMMPEEDRALGRAREKRRREFAIGRTCARRALVQLGRPATAILPGARRQPLWPEGIVGSITHCPGYCAAAVGLQSQFRAVGIDAEVHQPLPLGVLGLAATQQERDHLQALPRMGIHWDRALFSAKESVFKAWFPVRGIELRFEDVTVTFHPRRRTLHAFLRLAEIGLVGRYHVTRDLVFTAFTEAVPRGLDASSPM